jgi:5'-nucleotidase
MLSLKDARTLFSDITCDGYVPTILVDMDGVLAWWEKRFISEMRRRHPNIRMFDFGVRTELDQTYIDKIFDTDEVQDVLRTPGFYLGLDAVAGGRDALFQMRDLGFNVDVCTSPSLRNPTCASDKYHWVERELDRDFARKTIITFDKTSINGDVLVDDKVKVRGFHQPVWTHIVFDQSYNRADQNRPRIIDWGNWHLPVHSVLQQRRQLQLLGA